MNAFITKFYCYDQKPISENVESDSDSDEFPIEIKENVGEGGKDSKVVVAPIAKKIKCDNCIQQQSFWRGEKKEAEGKLPLKMTVMMPYRWVCLN